MLYHAVPSHKRTIKWIILSMINQLYKTVGYMLHCYLHVSNIVYLAKDGPHIALSMCIYFMYIQPKFGADDAQGLGKLGSCDRIYQKKKNKKTKKQTKEKVFKESYFLGQFHLLSFTTFYEIYYSREKKQVFINISSGNMGYSWQLDVTFLNSKVTNSILDCSLLFAQ